MSNPSKKLTISEFLAFHKKTKKKEKNEVKKKVTDKRAPLFWLEIEEEVLFFIYNRHGYNSVRSKLWKFEKKGVKQLDQLVTAKKNRHRKWETRHNIKKDVK